MELNYAQKPLTDIINDIDTLVCKDIIKYSVTMSSLAKLHINDSISISDVARKLSNSPISIQVYKVNDRKYNVKATIKVEFSPRNLIDEVKATSCKLANDFINKIGYITKYNVTIEPSSDYYSIILSRKDNVDDNSSTITCLLNFCISRYEDTFKKCSETNENDWIDAISKFEVDEGEDLIYSNPNAYDKHVALITSSGKIIDATNYSVHGAFVETICSDFFIYDVNDALDYVVDDLGFITFNDGHGSVEPRFKLVLPQKRPSTIQMRVVTELIRDRAKINQDRPLIVYIRKENGSELRRFDTQLYSAEDIIKSINRVYTVSMWESLNSDDKILYHGTNVSGITSFRGNTTTWLTPIRTYAMSYSNFKSTVDSGNGCIYECKLKSGTKTYNVGSTGIKVHLPTTNAKAFLIFTNEFLELMNVIKITSRQNIIKFLDEIVEETKTNKELTNRKLQFSSKLGYVDGTNLIMRLSDIVKSDIFRKKMLEVGYDGVECEEFDKIIQRKVITYGIFNSNDIEVVKETPFKYDYELDKVIRNLIRSGIKSSEIIKTIHDENPKLTKDDVIMMIRYNIKEADEVLRDNKDLIDELFN